jgi:Flp pilus assembly protein TadG
VAGRIHGQVSRARAFAGERGQTVVLTVVWMTVLLGMAGLVIDVGGWYRSQRGLQAKADASALAGAQELPANLASAGGFAQTYATKNGFALPASGISFSGDSAPNDSITVKVDDTAPTFFTKLFGLNTVTVRAEATAKNSPIGEARFVAPITVNIKHPMLSGKLHGKDCPCFDEPTELPLDKTGAPGAFGLIDLDEGKGNGSKVLGGWILNGFDGLLAVDADYSSNTGAKFNSTDIDSALDARLGSVLLFPVYDTLKLQGTNAIYHVVAWVGFKLTGYKITGGNSGSLIGQFVSITWQGTPAASGSGEPNLGVRIVTLTH